MNFSTTTKLDLLIAELQGQVKITRLAPAKPKKADLYATTVGGCRGGGSKKRGWGPVNHTF